MSEQCRSCGAAIVWALGETGRCVPVDAALVQTGNVLLVGLGDPPRAVHARNGTHVEHCCEEAGRS
jgi:hypothetical protein